MALATEDEKIEAERIVRQANERLGKIRDAERYEENKGCVGKTYRYRNNYSCPEKPSDYWWMYAKVQKITKKGHLVVFQFQTDKYGETTIKTNPYQYHMNDGYQEITKTRFEKAWRDLQKKIRSTKP